MGGGRMYTCVLQLAHYWKAPNEPENVAAGSLVHWESDQLLSWNRFLLPQLLLPQSSPLGYRLPSWSEAARWGFHKHLYMWNPCMAEEKVNSMESVIVAIMYSLYYLHAMKTVHILMLYLPSTVWRNCIYSTYALTKNNKSHPWIRAALN